MLRSCALLALVACGAARDAPSPSPSPPPAPPPAPAPPIASLVAVDVAAEITQLGDAWRAHPTDTAPLAKLVELARASQQWRAAVPYLAESLATTDVAIDGAFDAIVALGPTDPKVTVAILAPITHDDWTRAKIPYDRVAAAHRRVGRR